MDMDSSPTPPADKVPALVTIALWPADVLSRHLVSEEPTTRTTALGMALQTGAPVDACVQALVRCVTLSIGDPLAAQMAAAALGGLTPSCATPDVHECMAQLAMPTLSTPVRITAVHAMFRLKCLPQAAHDSVCSLLLDTDSNARKVALLAISPFAREAAASIAKQVAGTSPDRWTSEALHALARSAGDDNHLRSQLEAYVMRNLPSAPLLPTGIAAYGALAQLNPQGPAITALVQVAGDVSNPEPSWVALEALGELGAAAQHAAKSVAQMLLTTDDPAREELLCRTLLRLKPSAKDLPLARILQRVENAPDRACAAHCMLLGLHAKDFAPAAAVVSKRFALASAPLGKILSQVHQALAGTELAEPEVKSAPGP
jgi:hypothetical protein